MKRAILELKINGVSRQVLVAPNRTLLELLREDLDLTGTKFGCEQGECGACTVLIDDLPALSCVTLARLCDGKEISTVEGLSGEVFDRVSKAFAEAGATQCGYCTPGMALMMERIARKGGDVNVREALSGNICRCTGYVGIIKACEASLNRDND